MELMKFGEIVAYGVGTIGLVTAIDCFYTFNSLDLDKHGKVCPDPSSEVARMLEIQRVFYDVKPGFSYQSGLPVQQRTETTITLRDILTNTEVEMKYKGLLKEFDTLAISNDAEEYIKLCSENKHTVDYLIALATLSPFPISFGYMIGYMMTKERRQKEKNKG